MKHFILALWIWGFCSLQTPFSADGIPPEWLLQELSKLPGGQKVRNRATDFPVETISEEIKTQFITLRKGGLESDPELIASLLTSDFQGSFYSSNPALLSVPDCKLQMAEFFQKFERIREAFAKLNDFYEYEAWEHKALIDMKLDFRAVLKDKSLYSAQGNWWAIAIRASTRDPWRIHRSSLNSWKEESQNIPYFKSVTEATGLKLFSPEEREIMGFVEMNTRTQAEATHLEYGGILAGDYDNDGFPDLFIPNAYGRDLLYRNNQNGTFTEVGRDFFKDYHSASRGGVFGDIDNDGDLDLFVTRSGFPLGRGEAPETPRSGNAFFLNENGKFVDRTQEAGLYYKGHSFTPTFFDYDKDGDLDLYVANYANKENLLDSADARNGEPNLLYENQGNGRFIEVAQKAGVAGNGWSFAVAVCDYNFDGHLDLYVANDFGVNVFYQNQGNKTFKEIALEKGIQDRGYGMGSVFADFNNDRSWDLYVSNMHSKTGERVLRTQQKIAPETFELLMLFARGNSLFQGTADGKFLYKSTDYGVHKCGWAWHADFFDYNADGFEDLFVLNGYVTGHSERDY